SSHIHLRHPEHEPKHIRIPRMPTTHQPEPSLKRHDVRPLPQHPLPPRLQQPRRTSAHHRIHPHLRTRTAPRPPQRPLPSGRPPPPIRNIQPQHRLPQSHPHTQTPRLLRPVPLHTGLICQPSRLHPQTTDPEQPIPKLHSHPRRRLQRQPTKHPPRPSHLRPHIGQRRHRHPTLHPQL